MTCHRPIKATESGTWTIWCSCGYPCVGLDVADAAERYGEHIEEQLETRYVPDDNTADALWTREAAVREYGQ